MPLINVQNLYYPVSRLLWILYWGLVLLFRYQWLQP